MSPRWQVLGTAVVNGEADELLAAYPRTFSWGEGRRLPAESKLVHLGAERALRAAGISSRGLGGRVGVVLASPTGGLGSYERFQASLGDPAGVQPMAFSYALPGIPTSVLSLYYGISGPVVHLSAEGGVDAALVALGLLESGLCEQVITGSWRFPSATAQACGEPADARVAIAVIGVPAADTAGRSVCRESPSLGASATDEDWHAALTDSPASAARRLTTAAGTLLLTTAGG